MSITNCTVKSCRGVCRNTLFHWAEDKEEAVISLTKILRGHSERTAGGWVEPSSFYPNSESFVGHKTGRRIPLSGGAGDLSPMRIPAAQDSECSCRALGKSGQGWVLFLLENEELRAWFEFLHWTPIALKFWRTPPGVAGKSSGLHPTPSTPISARQLCIYVLYIGFHARLCETKDLS